MTLLSYVYDVEFKYFVKCVPRAAQNPATTTEKDENMSFFGAVRIEEVTAIRKVSTQS